MTADRPGLREIFDEYAPFVWRVLRHVGVPSADLEDVSQEVFFTVLRRLESFEGRSKLRTWIYGICLRVASDHRRKAYVRREAPVADPPLGPVAAPQEHHVAHGEAKGWLLAALAALDEDKRAVFVLYEIEELTMKEVAEVLGCPLQTAYSRLHAARELVLRHARTAALSGADAAWDSEDGS